MEANCTRKEEPPLTFNEAVELPVIVVDTEQGKVVGEFHTYIKPTTDKLTPFCTEFCGITEEMVYGKDVPTFAEALDLFHKFLHEKGIL